jgi:hypothetical protein
LSRKTRADGYRMMMRFRRIEPKPAALQTETQRAQAYVGCNISSVTYFSRQFVELPSLLHRRRDRAMLYGLDRDEG